MPTDPTPQEKARDAIYLAIERKASKSLSPSGLKELADSYAKVAYGPQGGDYDGKQKTDSKYVSHGTQETNLHQTSHQGNTNRKPAGFGRE